MPKARLDGGGSGRRAALYIRVSTEEQAMHGLSLPAQRETLNRYAQDNGLLVVDTYVDEGITARKKYRNRGQFMRMLRDVRADKIDIILFIKLDRWFRNVADYYEIQRVLDDHGVRWIATEEEYDTTTANGRLHLNIKLSIAQDESDRTSERIKFVFDSKIQRGEVISGRVPLGYTIQNKRMAVEAEQSEIVRDIFARYLALRSVRALREYVMQRYGLVYSPTGLRMLLTNRRYIGQAHGQDGFCPAIIDRETFGRVQELVKQRAQRNARPGTGRVYLFTGLACCAECGGRLSVHTVGGKYIYYRCTRYEKRPQCPHRHRTGEPALEDWLLSSLAEQYAAYRVRAARPQNARPAADAALLRRKLEKLKDLYLNDLIDRESYARDYAALRSALRDAETPAPAQPPAGAEDLPSLPELYARFDREQKKAFWSKLLDKIILSNEDDFTAVLPSPYTNRPVC